MSEQTYSYFGGMFSKGANINSSRVIETLLDLKNRTIKDDREIIMTFCNALKDVLELDTVSSMIDELFSIESQLEQLKDNKVFQNYFFMDDFYRNLAPIILRSIQEGADVSAEGAFGDSLKEALRVAIEEEIYILTEEIGEMPSGTIIS
jgi:hypothetical protein